MRYIDADDTKKLIDCCADLGGILGEIIDHVKSYAKLMVEATPTADVVEVTRCKDCKYFAKYGNESYTWKTCLAHVGDTFGISDNFYCRLGTRKGAEEKQCTDI